MTCSLFFFEPKAVEAISATSASDIHCPVVSSKIALVYLMELADSSGYCNRNFSISSIGFMNSKLLRGRSLSSAATRSRSSRLVDEMETALAS